METCPKCGSSNIAADYPAHKQYVPHPEGGWVFEHVWTIANEPVDACCHDCEFWWKIRPLDFHIITEGEQIEMR